MTEENYDHIVRLNNCGFHKNMTFRNPEYREIVLWQREKISINDSAKAIEFEMSKRYFQAKQGATVKERPRKNFCDGEYHYLSFGTDPCYSVKRFCPNYWNKISKDNPDIKRGLL